MKIKTQNLTGPALDWAAAKAAGVPVTYNRHNGWVETLDQRFAEPDDPHVFSPSTDWAQAGPIIEREKIEWQWLPSTDKAHKYGARKPSLGGLHRTFCMDGPTVLVAAMRCYVASKLGDEIEVPEELQ